MLQMPGAGTRTSHMRVHCGTRAPVLQVRQKWTPCKKMSRLHIQVSPVRIARGTCQPQDGRDGMHAAEDKEDNQEKNTLPRISHHGRNTGMLRHRRRRRRNNISSSSDEGEISHYYEDYREKRRALQQEIQIAKARSWMELVESVESDPWGRPYRLVTKKLRPPPPH
jgi:hypothetical protein